VTKIKVLRIVTVSLVLLVIASGAVGELRYSGICTLGAWKIWGTCPLGFLERSLATRELLPQWPTALAVVVSVILLGRYFCAWICPTVVLRRVFSGKVKLQPKRLTTPKRLTWSTLSPYAFLGGALLASYLFKFPVFCLFCPFGLFFGFLHAAGQYFSLDMLTLDLVLFPAMLALELWGLKSWCRSICPLGALYSIFGNLNRTLVLTPREGGCLTTKGADCNICEQVCPEGIELGNISRKFWPQSCTKCLECYEKCPAKEIKLAVFK